MDTDLNGATGIAGIPMRLAEGSGVAEGEPADGGAEIVGPAGRVAGGDEDGRRTGEREVETEVVQPRLAGQEDATGRVPERRWDDLG